MSAISIKSVSKQYDSGLLALDKVNLTVKKGDFFALLGPNGAGKTTIIQVLVNLIQRDGGSVSVFGFDLDKDTTSVKKSIGLVPQEFNFNLFETVLDIVCKQAGYYGVPRKKALARAQFLLEELGLWDKRFSVSRHLSGGMKRRLMVARALMHEPNLLILDEPTAGVDVELRKSMWVFLKKMNKMGVTIVLTTHYLEEAEALCNHIAILDYGKVVKDMPLSKLLKTIDQETYIVTTDTPMQSVTVKGYSLEVVDENTVEIEIGKGQTINELVALLSKKKICITNMQPKTNRLETLLTKLVKHE